MTIRLPLLWFSTLILFAALLVQLARWKRCAETEKGLARVETAHIGAEHRKWFGKLSDAEERQRRLEAQLLWSGRESLLPQLGALSQGLSLSLVGVEELQESRRGGYLFRPVHLSFSGDYAGFTTCLSVVERITPTVRIEEVRLYRRKREVDRTSMSLTFASMHKTVESDERRMEDKKQKLATNLSPLVSIKMPAIERFSVKRNPFAFDLPVPPSNSARHRLKETSLPQLTGILWDGANPTAMLDNGGEQLSARVGEVVAGATVLSIQLQRVVLKRGGQQHELRLWKKQ